MSGQPRAQQGSEGKVLHAVGVSTRAFDQTQAWIQVLSPTMVVPRKSVNASIEIKVGKGEFKITLNDPQNPQHIFPS